MDNDYRDVPCRDAKYMGLALIISSFSKDPNTQIGSVIINPQNNKPLGWGYNGPPKNIGDKDIDWNRPNKHDYMVHSEINAILHSNILELEGATLYVTAPPCPKCMLVIITSGIKRIVYLNLKVDKDSSINSTSLDKSKNLASKSGVVLEQFKHNLDWLYDYLNNIKTKL